MISDDNKNLNKGKPFRYKREDWAPAVQIFSEISTWIAVPIILALIAGKALDGKYDTKPTFLLVMAGIAFLVSTYGIVKAVKNFAKKNGNK